jgi:hypothetical protein
VEEPNDDPGTSLYRLASFQRENGWLVPVVVHDCPMGSGAADAGTAEKADGTLHGP